MATGRPLDQVRCLPLGSQTLRDRFPNRSRHEETPPNISPWRCNLTALSHTHNLYFVAYGALVYVYVPQFPGQELLEQPAVIVPSQPSIPGKSGFLSMRESHAINSLLVQHLGNDEVVATVRDDGDVDVVLVRHIVQAIDRRAETGTTLSVVATELRPIFQTNVEMSAWGLAIHTQARILATSSNLHEVRIFKFGLVDVNNATSDPEVGIAMKFGGDLDTIENGRGDVTQSILNGSANIPHIAFCNTGDDPYARWLLTTDVNGDCRVMDLHTTSASDVTANEFRMGPPGVHAHRGVFDRTHAGWGVMFLDRRSFIPHVAWDAACGLRTDNNVLNGNDDDEFVDITNSGNFVQSMSHAFYFHSDPPDDDADMDSTRVSHGGPEDPLSQTNPSPQDAPPHQTVSNLTARTYASIELIPDDFQQPPDGTMYFSDDDDDDDDDDDESNADNDEDDSDNEDEDNLYEEIEEVDEVLEDYGSEDLISDEESDAENNEASNYRRHMRALLPSNCNPGYSPTALCNGLPCPILHTSVRNVYLLQPANPKRPGIPTTGPVISLQDPLRQSVDVQWGLLNEFNRLNMHAYIPELGVVVVASQKGRAAIISLTKAARPSDRRERAGHTCYSMRLDAVIPYETQERKNHRPPFPLHGIAVGPVQGTEVLSLERKRWRLMLMYQDHSILSYEIQRGSMERKSNDDIHGIMI